MLTRDAFLIGGRWASPAGATVVDVVSPITEEIFGRVPESVTGDVDAAVASARRAFEDGPWPRMTVRERGDYLLQTVQVLQARFDEAVHLQIDEMGSPVAFMDPATRSRLNGLASQIETVAAIDLSEVRDGIAGKILVTRDPIGVVAGIVPWNGPIMAILSKMFSALLTGCPIVLKPPPETPLSPYLISDALVEVGLPDGVVSILPGGREVGEYLVGHPGIDKVTFTGSSAAGARVAALCGEQLKTVTLELGGKSAAIVLPDADLDRDLATMIGGSLPNNGQVCNATTRILAPRNRSAELVDRLVAAVGSMTVGDPHESTTDFGPLVASRQRDRVEGYISTGLAEGAVLALGGGRPASQPLGWYVEPTIFTGVSNSMQIAREEIFGPVLVVIDYDTVDEAIAIANDSDYGLGGAVYTSDVDHGLEVARRIKTGTCRINEAPMGGAGGPFGGVKRSGIGRENAREGHEGYYDVKTISLPPGYVPAEAQRQGTLKEKQVG